VCVCVCVRFITVFPSVSPTLYLIRGVVDLGNTLGCQPNSNFNDFSLFNPFNDSSHFHSYCEIEDWTDQHQVQFCRLANLPDLAQENPFVRSTLKQWISSIVTEYGFDGIRIDTVPEVPPDFWSEYADAAGVFNIGEVDNGDIDYNAQYQGPLNAVCRHSARPRSAHTFASRLVSRPSTTRCIGFSAKCSRSNSP
jgi:alpha-amylase